jgi:hypothetical protein
MLWELCIRVQTKNGILKEIDDAEYLEFRSYSTIQRALYQNFKEFNSYICKEKTVV